MKRLILFLLICYLVSSLSTGIDAKKEACFQVEAKKNATLTITYVISGFQEENVEMKVFDPTKRLLHTRAKGKEGTHKEIVPDNGLYEVCFRSLDSYYKLVSFDFDFQEDKGLALAGISKIEIYKKETMEEIAKELKNAYKTMQQIQRNQHFQSDREGTHQSMLESTEKSLKYCSIAKMMVLVVICVSQIYMLTSYFKDKTFGPNV